MNFKPSACLVDLASDRVLGERGTRIVGASWLFERMRMPDPRHAQLSFDGCVERLQIFVVDGPIFEGRILYVAERRPQVEIDRVQPVEISGHVNGSTSDYRRDPAGCRAGCHGRLPDAQCMGVLGHRWNKKCSAAHSDLVVVEVFVAISSSFVEDHDTNARLRERIRYGGSARPASHDDDIDRISSHRSEALRGGGVRVHPHGQRWRWAKPDHVKAATPRVPTVLWITESPLQRETENDRKERLTAVVSVLP